MKLLAPYWDVSGVGQLSWQGISSVDLSDDGKLAAIGTIAPCGDPNIFLIDESGVIIAENAIGIRWINEVSIRSDGMLTALSAISTGQAGDSPRLYTFMKDNHKEEYPNPLLFHYGYHSNHLATTVKSKGSLTSILSNDNIRWNTIGEENESHSHIEQGKGTLSFAICDNGRAVLGLVAESTEDGKEAINLILVEKGKQNPLWQRPVVSAVDTPQDIEKGVFGPTAFPCNNLPAYGVLAVAIDSAGKRIASADYQGWRRIVRSNIELGYRFMPARPSIRVYDDSGNIIREIDPKIFEYPFWCDLTLSSNGQKLYIFPHSWACRGLAGQSILPADDNANQIYVADVDSGEVTKIAFPDTVSDLAILPDGRSAIACWDGNVYVLSSDLRIERQIEIGSPSLLDSSANGRLLISSTPGIIHLFDYDGKQLWNVDLNKSATPGKKAWTQDQQAPQLATDVWRTQGNLTHSDLGGQYLIRAPEGLILIDPNAGASFEQNWAKILSTGNDPMDVKYILLTHEHGDHAPGAYLWRVITGAKVIASPETAYIMQNHIPYGTGYGLHPPTKTDIVVDKDTEMNLAGLPVRIVRSPGHTYGSLSFVVEKDDQKIVALGDLIMPGGVLGYSGHHDFSAENAMNSLKKLRDISPDLVIGGHGNGDPSNFIDKGIEVGEATGWSQMKPAKPDRFYGFTQKNYLIAAWVKNINTAAYGDINGDGRPDIVAFTQTSEGGRVDIYLNHSGIFYEEPDKSILIPNLTPDNERKIRIGHINNDGIADIFLSNEDSPIILISKDGKMEYDVIMLNLGVVWPTQLVAEDINNNGLKDLIIGCRFQDRFHISYRNPDCSFQPVESFQTSGIYFDLEVMDFNGDSKLDIALSSGDIFLSNDDGTLAGKPSIKLQSFPGWTFMGAGDFNGDGRKDIVIIGAKSGEEKGLNLNVFFNTGDTKLPFKVKPDQQISLPNAAVLRDGPAVADWNVDGIDDLVLTTEDRRGAIIIPGTKNGLDPDKAITVPFDYIAHYDTKFGVMDFNGDGLPDIASFGPANSQAVGIYIWLQKAKGQTILY